MSAAEIEVALGGPLAFVEDHAPRPNRAGHPLIGKANGPASGAARSQFAEFVPFAVRVDVEPRFRVVGPLRVFTVGLRAPAGGPSKVDQGIGGQLAES